MMKIVVTKNKYISQSELEYLLENLWEHKNISICSFSSYSKNDFDEESFKYVNELAKYFTLVIIMTNIERGVTKKPENFPLNCAICYANNEGLDFGFHWRLLIPLSMHKICNSIEKIGLINDSCNLLGSLQDIFSWSQSGKYENLKKKQVWGITKSFEGHEHLQSYFLVFQGSESISVLFQFCNEHDVFKCKTKQDIISTFEIGLSKYFLKNNFELDAPYTSESVTKDAKNKRRNPSYIFWKEMINEGCPLIKKNRRK